MTGLEPLVVGYFIRWATQKARVVGGHVDGKADLVLKALTDRIVAKLGGDSALRQLERESAEGVDNPRTTRRAELAVAEAVETDPDFGADLATLVRELQRLSPTSPQASVVINATATDRAQMPVAGGTQINTFHNSRD